QRIRKGKDAALREDAIADPGLVCGVEEPRPPRDPDLGRVGRPPDLELRAGRSRHRESGESARLHEEGIDIERDVEGSVSAGAREQSESSYKDLEHSAFVHWTLSG